MRNEWNVTVRKRMIWLTLFGWKVRLDTENVRREKKVSWHWSGLLNLGGLTKLMDFVK